MQTKKIQISLGLPCPLMESLDAVEQRSGPEVIKLFFMLNSAEHEIFSANKSQIIIANSFLLIIAEHEHCSANKYENANYCWHFHIY